MATIEIHGYSDEIAAAPGERIRFMVSCTGAESYRADIVRLIHGDTNPAGPGFKEEVEWCREKSWNVRVPEIRLAPPAAAERRRIKRTSSSRQSMPIVYS